MSSLLRGPKTGLALACCVANGDMQMKILQWRNVSCISLIRDPRVWVPSLGKGRAGQGSPTAGSREVGVNQIRQTFGSRMMANREEAISPPTPRWWFAGRQGVCTEATEAAEELLSRSRYLTDNLPLFHALR